jgi:DNA-binding transcriptional LysR family regulator
MTDIRSIDVPLLRAFDALMRERSVSRAALRLHLSQPATSALLSRLRDLFSDPLFVRTSGGVVPTPRAETLAEPVRKVLADLQALLEPAQTFHPDTSDRTFHVAANDYITATLLGPLAAKLMSTAPRVRLALVLPDMATLPQRVASGEVDVALLRRGRPAPGLKRHTLFDEDFVLALERSHPLARKRRLRPADLATVPHVFVSPTDASFSGAADEALRAAGVERFVQLSVAQFGAAVDVIERGGHAAVLPRRVAHAHAHRVAIRPLPFEMPGFSMDWVIHPRSAEDAGLRWLQQEMQLAADQLLSPPKR